MFVTVTADGTPQEIADLLFAVRNRQVSDVKVSLKTRTGKQELCREIIGGIDEALDKKPEICSPLSTLEGSVKTALESFRDTNEGKQDLSEE